MKIKKIVLEIIYEFQKENLEIIFKLLKPNKPIQKSNKAIFKTIIKRSKIQHYKTFL